MGNLDASVILNNGSGTSGCIFQGHASYWVMNLRSCYSREVVQKKGCVDLVGCVYTSVVYWCGCV